MNTLQVLIDARKLIEKPECWCQEAYAKDCLGLEINENSPKAVAFCSAGAIDHVVGPDADAILAVSARSAVTAAADTFKGSLTWWNDHPSRKHAEVLAAFDRAIEAERAKVQP